MIPHQVLSVKRKGGKRKRKEKEAKK